MQICADKVWVWNHETIANSLLTSLEPINGFELYRRLIQVNPNLRVCFITAFEVYYDEFKRVFPKIKMDCFVHKPVGMEKLVAIIRKELERVADEIPNMAQDLSTPDTVR